MTAQRIKKLTVEEYVELEQATNTKHEYHNGEVFALAGGTLNHSRLCSNILYKLRNNLESKDNECEVFNSDTKLNLEAFGNQYVYPDTMVVCGKFKHPENFEDAITNPILIVEVLSDGTKAYDRGKKFEKYKSIQSFREYVLIAQDKPSVEIFYRNKESEDWQNSCLEGLDKTFHLQSLQIDIELNALYERVVFKKDSKDK